MKRLLYLGIVATSLTLAIVTCLGYLIVHSIITQDYSVVTISSLTLLVILGIFTYGFFRCSKEVRGKSL